MQRILHTDGMEGRRLHALRAGRATRRARSLVMGMRGLGAVARLVLGSVSMKVLQLADVPVTLVK
jgi:nucleotide-binding universal stress UspA family protein